MQRSINAVLLGTFTLRFSTGLTGAMLLYSLAQLPEFGGSEVSGSIAGLMTAAYFAAELVLSPLFGVLSDRVGAHRIMQVGPVLGAIAVIVTALTTDLWLLGGTRWVEGMAAAASIPSILGYISIATSGNDGLGGQTVARFEAATIAGLGVGAVAAGPLFEILGRGAFVANAVIYAISFVIYRYGVRRLDPDEEASAAAEERPISSAEVRPPSGSLRRYGHLLASSGVWLLAPTWIALNAIIGAWTTQSVFQLVRENPDGRFDDQLLMGGFEPSQVSIGLAVALAGFFAGNHSAGWPILAPVALVLLAIAGLFVLAGATPAALGMLADISESHPSDRGAIMGLYSVFLGLGQIVGSVSSGTAADWLGIDGPLPPSRRPLLISLR